MKILLLPINTFNEREVVWILKAIILAGGKGERLMPLTSHIPKPMVPILNKPLLEYIIQWLKKQGIEEIILTVNYLKDVIKRHFQSGEAFGVNIRYIEESYPLGTAGGVKLAQPFIDDTFLVISGDAFTDINLLKAKEFHKKHGQICTVVTKSVEMPIDYGLVIGDPSSNEIKDMIEKPNWNEVCTNLVNTGIYILQPNIFHYMKDGIELDFSRDVFPNLLKKNHTMYYFETSDYWSDIGNLIQYRQAQFDLLSRKINLPIEANEIKDGVWLEDGVVVNRKAQLSPPIYIGRNSYIGENSYVGEFTVIGRYSHIQEGCCIDHSILWQNLTMLNHVQMTGATVASKCVIEENAVVFDGAVLGDGVHVKKESRIGENVYIWPDKKIPPYSYEKEHVKWSRSKPNPLFMERGVEGVTNREFTPEFATKLALAFGSTIAEHSFVLLGHNGHPFAKILTEIMNQSLLSVGIQTMTCNESLSSPIFRYACRKESVSYGLFIQTDRSGKVSNVEFLASNGAPIDSKLERDIERSFMFLNFRRTSGNRTGYEWKNMSVINDYFHELLHLYKMPLHSNYHFGVVNETTVHPFSFFEKSLPCDITSFSQLDTKEQFSEQIRVENLDGGFWFEPNGEKVFVFDQNGYMLEESKMEGVLLYLASSSPFKEKIFISPIHDRKKELRALKSPYSLQYDAFYFFVSFIHLFLNKKEDLSYYHSLNPTMHLMYEEVSCHWLKRGEIMRMILEECDGELDSELNGVRIQHDSSSWTFIIPHSDKPVITVFTKAKNAQMAKDKTDYYMNKIVHYQKS